MNAALQAENRLIDSLEPICGGASEACHPAIAHRVMGFASLYPSYTVVACPSFVWWPAPSGPETKAAANRRRGAL